MSHGLAAARAGDPAGATRPILIGIVLAEALLIALGLLAGHPLLAAAAAAAVAYFFIAFRAPDLAWALVWVAVPADLEIRLSGGSALTVPTEPMILLALLAWLMRGLLQRPWSLPASPLHLPLAALAAWALLSTVWSVRPVSTLKAWVTVGGYVAFCYLYFLQGRCDGRRRRRWLRLVALTGAAWGVFGIVRVLVLGGVEREAATITSNYSYGAFRPFFSEHGTYSAYLGMLLPAALLAAMERTGRERILYGVSALCIGSGVVLAFARAEWLALLVVIPATALAWAARQRATHRLLLPVAMAVAVALFVGALGISRQITRHAESVVSSENVSNLERLNRWNAALSMTRDRPLTGVGFGCYLDAYRTYRTRILGTEQAYIRMGTHSEPLKVLSELGVPGLLLALWLLWAIFRLALRSFRRLPDPEDRLLALAALAGLGTYLVDGLFNAYLVEAKVTVPFWAAIGVIGALGRRLKPDRGP